MNNLMPRVPARIRLDDFEDMLLNKPEDEKWELIDGRIIKSMVGARWEHKQIVVNLLVAVTNHLRNKGSTCRAFDETFWVRDPALDVGSFPDLLIHCGKLEPGATSVDDPIILVEVVSPSSEMHDRLVKRVAYQKIPSLQQYVLVARDFMLIDAYTRTTAGWTEAVQLQAPDQKLVLPAIALELPLGEIYRDVLV